LHFQIIYIALFLINLRTDAGEGSALVGIQGHRWRGSS
jgi:hypothetical protein